MVSASWMDSAFSGRAKSRKRHKKELAALPRARYLTWLVANHLFSNHPSLARSLPASSVLSIRVSSARAPSYSQTQTVLQRTLAAVLIASRSCEIIRDPGKRLRFLRDLNPQTCGQLFLFLQPIFTNVCLDVFPFRE